MAAKHLSTKLHMFCTCALVLSLAAASTAQPVGNYGDPTSQFSQQNVESKTVTELKTTIKTNGDTETKTITETKTMISKAKPFASSTPDLAKELIGTWALETPPTESNPSGIGRRLKLVTETHWTMVEPDAVGRVFFNKGGTYSIKGNVLTENTDFANELAAQHIGRTFKISISIVGDTLTQTGIDTSFTETWKRVK